MSVAASRDVAVIVDLARLVAPCRQPEPGADRSGPAEVLRILNRGQPRDREDGQNGHLAGVLIDSHASSLEPDLFRTFAAVTYKRFAQHLPALFSGRAQQAAGPLPHRVGTPVKARRVPARFLVD